MDSLLLGLPFWLILGLGLCLIVLIASLGVSLFMLIFKAGVVINEARKPPHMDAGDYRLEQGREVRAEAAGRRTTENTER